MIWKPNFQGYKLGHMKLSFCIIATLLFFSSHSQNRFIIDLKNNDHTTVTCWPGSSWIINVVKVSGIVKGWVTFEEKVAVDKERIVKKFPLSDVVKQTFRPTFNFQYMTFETQGTCWVKIGIINICK
jgi:hypothetical protein